MSWKIKNIGVPSTDTNISNVSLLLHGDGTNGSTTIIDTSYSPKTITAFGDAKISTAQSKFGGASLAFDGNSYVQTSSSASVSVWSTDFCVEYWIYITSFGSGNNHIWTNSLSTSDGLTGQYINSNASVLFGRLGVNETVSSAGIIVAGQWIHIATVRLGNTLTFYKNGSSFHNTTNMAVLETTTTRPMTIGKSFQAGPEPGLNGYIDDFRITKGIARYTSNFTPPTAPFPDF